MAIVAGWYRDGWLLDGLTELLRIECVRLMICTALHNGTAAAEGTYLIMRYYTGDTIRNIQIVFQNEFSLMASQGLGPEFAIFV